MKWQLKNNTKVLPQSLISVWKQIGISPILGKILYNRGLSNKQDIEIFLNPSLKHLPPLEVWPELLDAAKYLSQKISKGAKLAIWGDYDVDGITSTALLTDFFRQKNISVLTYIPSRSEGYGLNEPGLKKLQEQGINIVLTVDCGISQCQEAAFAKSCNLELIITDHHTPPAQLPEAKFILNPKLINSAYTDLAGVGVAFLFAAALNRFLPGPKLDIRYYLDLVALGTIADVVELSWVNRILTKNGLLVLANSQRPGIIALKEKSGLSEKKKLGSGDIGFILGPRLNACGRLKTANPALRLLLETDINEARKIANELESLNTQRRQVEEEILKQACLQAKNIYPTPGLVLFAPNWHEGVIGIVASKIVQEFYRPCIILTEDNGFLKGSGRSIPEIDLYAILNKTAHLLESFGGHKMAAGLKLKKENFPSFQKQFQEIISQTYGDKFTPTIYLDALINFNALTPSLIKELEMLQPFGPGNPRPLFLSPLLEVKAQNFFGMDDSHISFYLKDTSSNLNLEGKIWHQGHKYKNINFINKKVRLAFSPRLNNYRDLLSVTLQIEEILEVQ
ncbi:MAG: single-stranded-DNA-specific exonuclease RecJ [Desulfonauticus sp.]|nr:single-stranded-DNA-specific exonuclease RecJ [Desulfonauticus sp.]